MRAEATDDEEPPPPVARRKARPPCRIACVDLVEDRVRSRITGLLVLYGLFAWLAVYTLLGGLNERWNRDDDTRVAGPNGTQDIRELTKILEYQCVAERRCERNCALNGCADADACGTKPCLSLLSDPPATGNLSCPGIDNATAFAAGVAAAAANGTADDAAAAIAALCGGDDLGDTIGMWIAVAFFLLFLLVALFGNSTFHATVWAYPAFLASVILVICIPVVIEAYSPLFLVWWLPSLALFFAFGVVVLGLLLTSRGKTPPESIVGWMARDFHQTRQVSYLAYCKELLQRRDCAAQIELKAGLAVPGKLSAARQMELEGMVKEYERARYGWPQMLRQLLGLRRGPASVRFEFESEAGDAAFVPLRLQLAVAVSMLCALLLSNTWIRYGIDLGRRVQRLDHAYISPLYNSVRNVAEHVNSTDDGVLTPLPSSVLEGTLVWLSGHITSGRYALEAATVGSAIVAFGLSCLALLGLVLDFRASVLRARQGKLPPTPYAPEVIGVRHAWHMVGGVIAGTALSFLYVGVVVGCIVFLLAWTLAWEALGSVMVRLWGVVLFVLLVGPFAWLCSAVVSKHVGPGSTITSRFWWMAYDFVCLFLHLFSGILSAIGRLIAGTGVLLVHALRPDISLYPSWIERGGWLGDGLAKAMRATVLLYHAHNNPVVHAFLWTVASDAASRRASMEARADKPTSYEAHSSSEMLESGSAKLRVSNRWRKARMLLRNPHLVLANKEMLRAAALEQARQRIERDGSGRFYPSGMNLSFPSFISNSALRGESSEPAAAAPTQATPAAIMQESATAPSPGPEIERQSAVGLAATPSNSSSTRQPTRGVVASGGAAATPGSGKAFSSIDPADIEAAAADIDAEDTPPPYRHPRVEQPPPARAPSAATANAAAAKGAAAPPPKASSRGGSTTAAAAPAAEDDEEAPPSPSKSYEDGHKRRLKAALNVAQTPESVPAAAPTEAAGTVAAVAAESETQGRVARARAAKAAATAEAEAAAAEKEKALARAMAAPPAASAAAAEEAQAAGTATAATATAAKPSSRAIGPSDVVAAVAYDAVEEDIESASSSGSELEPTAARAAARPTQPSEEWEMRT